MAVNAIQQSVYAVTPASGATVVIPDGAAITNIQGAATLAALTIMFPPNPVQGLTHDILFDVAVTALTVAANTGQAIHKSPVTTVTADTAIRYVYIGQVWKLM